MCNAQECILLKWRSMMSGKGVTPLPSEAELRAICAQGRIQDDPPATVARWGHVIAFLLSQSRFGVNWDGIHLTQELSRPLDLPNQPTDAAGAGSTTSATPMDRLRTWRDKAIADGRLASGSVMDNQLMLLIRPLSSPADVGQRVRALAPFADEVFEFMGGALPSDSGSSPAAEEEVAKTRPRSALATETPTPAPPSSGTTHSATARPRGTKPIYPSTPEYPGPSDTTAAVKEPEPAPAAEDAPQATQHPGRDDGKGPVKDDENGLDGGFAEALTVADGTAATVIDQVASEFGMTYRWPEVGGPVTVYRVVTSETQRPLVPEMGEVLVTTMSNSAVDPAPVAGVFRFVQVWANTGTAIAAAKASQPQLVAECVRVGTIREASGGADFGQVSLRWTAPAGAERVRVYRLPSDPTSPPPQQAVEISTDRTNLTGVIDLGGEAGARYVYRMIVEARDSSASTHKSSPVDVELEWPAVIREVADLTIHPVRPPTKYEPGLVDLAWTPPPVGSVQIYRIAEPLGAGILGVEVDKGALPQMGLTEKELRNNPVDGPGDSGRIKMLAVPWPPNWSRVHFVPVTILGQRAIPGKPATAESIMPPGDPRLADRVAQQVITFIWPSGATYVRAHLGPIGADATAICTGTPLHQVSEDDYRRHGGMRLALQPPTDAAIFLVAVRGEAMSVPVSVPLIKRLIIQYSVETHRRLRVGGVDYAKLAVWAPSDKVTGSPPFVAVFREDRLPMHARDGAILRAVPDETPDAAPTQVLQPATLQGGPTSPRWRFLLPGPASRGYLRLFVSPAVGGDMARKIVVLDPPVSQLRWAL